MIKKIALVTVAIMLLVFSASMSHANIIDGMFSGSDAFGTPQSSINPGGLGDSLLYGYYNVRGNLDLFNVVNTDTVNGQRVRVIFRNAKNSKECLDFTVCLSRGDVWTAYLMDNGSTAAIYRFDTDTITAPTLPTSGQAFKSGTYPDGYVVTPDDCREGYFEVVGLQQIPLYDKAACDASPSTCPLTGGATEAACRDYTGNVSVENVLMGNNAIFELATLGTFSYNALAIADASLGVAISPPAGSDYSIPRSMDNLCPEADFIFMKSAIVSPYDLMSALGGETELITLFPTRLACHKDQAGGMFEGASGNTDATKADVYCTSISTTIWDDREHKQDVTDFSPGLTLCLPYELNVIKIGGSNIWNSSVVSVISSNFDLGWITISLAGTGHTISYAGYTANGLPTVAYTTQSFANAAATYMVPTAYYTDIATIP